MPPRPRIPDLTRYREYPVVGLDTETNGLDIMHQAKMLSAAFPDGHTTSFAWGLADSSENNCSISDVQRLLDALDREGFTKVFHNAQFDIRMMFNAGLSTSLYNVEDTGTCAPLLNELENSFSLQYLGEKYVGQGKLQDEELIGWCHEQFGGQKTHKVQVKNYWKSPFWKIAPYCEQDASVTLKLYQKLRPQITEKGFEHLYGIESNLFPMLMKMHWAGVRANVERSERVFHEISRIRDLIEAKWDRGVRKVFREAGELDQLVGGSLNTRSGPQMEILFKALGEPYPRKEPTAKMIQKAGRKGIEPDDVIGNPSFPGSFLETVDNPLIGMCLQVRKLSHYADTFIRNYILDNIDPTGFIHGEFHPLKNANYGTESGRFSSGGRLNLQNIPKPKKGELTIDFEGVKWPIGKLLRSLFIPRKGHQWVKIDYSQIEYRFLAHYCAMLKTGGKLRQAYLDNPDADFHKMMADMVGVDRDPAKTLNFGIVYGMGRAKLARSLGVSEEEAEEILETYHGNAPEINAFSQFCKGRASKRGFVKTWGGRYARFRKEKGKWGGMQFARTHKALNSLLQGSAADLLKVSMVEVDKIIDWDEVVCRLTVHDELDFDISGSPESHRMIRDVKTAMEQFQDEERAKLFGFRSHITVPIIAEVEIGKSWGELSKWKFQEPQQTRSAKRQMSAPSKSSPTTNRKTRSESTRKSGITSKTTTGQSAARTNGKPRNTSRVISPSR